jgi:hypothetical protein
MWRYSAYLPHIPSFGYRGEGNILYYFTVRNLVSIIISFLYTFDRLPTQNIGTALVLLCVGVAYAIGYTIQDGLSLTGIVTTQNIKEPGLIVKWLYKRFTNEEWKPVGGIDVDKATDFVTEDKAEQELGEFQRIVTLRFIGTVVGPCAVISGILVVIKWLFERRATCDKEAAFDFWLALAALSLGVVLMALSWIKGAQQTQYAVERFRNSQGQVGEKPGSDAN